MDTEVLVTMCDANARVGSVQSSWIGPMRPEKENQKWTTATPNAGGI